jgi:hypothetical protein
MKKGGNAIHPEFQKRKYHNSSSNIYSSGEVKYGRETEKQIYCMFGTDINVPNLRKENEEWTSRDRERENVYMETGHENEGKIWLKILCPRYCSEQGT